MTSTAVVQYEIDRFLRSKDPEVICITGGWGAGKTYNWQTRLDGLRRERQIGLARYSYVSLFGINSLEGLKQSIFENLEFLVPEGRATLDRAVNGSNEVFKHSKKLINALSAIPYLGDALSKTTQPFFFSAIRSQIICIDDLERKGAALTVRDTLGLISFLREQRNCKIVILLNEDTLSQDNESLAEFKNFFEKVIDTKILFKPTATEAAAIAFGENHSDPRTSALSKNCIGLGITNIRVLKRIERLLAMIFRLPREIHERTENQIIHTVVLFGWCQYDSGAAPPPIKYASQSSLLRYVERRNGKEASENEKRWDTILSGYQFDNADKLDEVLREIVETGAIDDEALRREIAAKNQEFTRGNSLEALEQAYRPLHDSFSANEQEVCSSIVNGIEQNLSVTSLYNLDAAMTVLRRIGQDEQAKRLYAFARDNAPPAFWTEDDPFHRTIMNCELKAEQGKVRETQSIPFDFHESLMRASTTHDPTIIKQLAAAPVERFVELFDQETGASQRDAINAALTYRQILNATEEMKEVVSNAEEALSIIGSRSQLNALRVEKYGIRIDSDNRRA